MKIDAKFLQQFCRVSGDKKDPLSRPWTRDGYTYATNVALILQVPALDGVKENPMAPGTDFLELRKIPTIKNEGWFSIPDIPDDKLLEENAYIEIGRKPFNCRLLVLLKKLPMITIAPEVTASDKWAYLRFKGGVGAIMPMTRSL